MQNQRSIGVDFLKIFLVALVIISHSGLPYFLGPNGYWYVRSATYNVNFFSPWNFSFNAFIINTFFFISGIFSFYSLQKHGELNFLASRVKKLLIPLILGFLFILPPLEYYYYLNYQPVNHVSFFEYFFSYWFGLSPEPANWVGHYPDMNLGHLWFLEHLIIYSFFFAVLFYGLKKAPYIKLDFKIYIVIISVLTIILTYIMKQQFPITQMTSLLGFIQIDFTHVMQNFILFFAGVYFAKANFEAQMSTRVKSIIFYIGVFFALFPFIIFYLFPDYTFIFNQLSSFAVWESLTAVTFSIGSVVYINKILTGNHPFIVYLGNLSYSMYVIHVIFVCAFQIVTENLLSDPILKFVIVSLSSIVLTLIASLVLSYAFNYIKILSKQFKTVS